MSDDDSRRFDRRNVLKAIGAAGGISALGSGVSALEGDAKAERIETATATESFAAFEAEFGGIEVAEDRSSVTEDADAGVVRVELATSLGTMGVILLKRDGEAHDIALLDLADAEADALPRRYTGAPEGTDPLLFTSDELDGLEFRRSATRREKAALAERTGIDADELRANLESERGGFVVGGPGMSDEEFLVVEPGDFGIGEVDPTEIAAGDLREEELESQLGWWCAWKCGSCLSKAASCVGCCVATTVGCIACIIWQCGIGAKSCYDCYNCLQ